MSRFDELDRLDQEDQDRFDRYGYPDTPEMAAEQAWRDEQEAFEKESRYFDAPPARVSDDWLEDLAA
mgnify:CR=1 FL=1